MMKSNKSRQYSDRQLYILTIIVTTDVAVAVTDDGDDGVDAKKTKIKKFLHQFW